MIELKRNKKSVSDTVELPESEIKIMLRLLDEEIMMVF